MVELIQGLGSIQVGEELFVIWGHFDRFHLAVRKSFVQQSLKRELTSRQMLLNAWQHAFGEDCRQGFPMFMHARGAAAGV